MFQPGLESFFLDKTLTKQAKLNIGVVSNYTGRDKNGNFMPMNAERRDSTSLDNPSLSNRSKINRF